MRESLFSRAIGKEDGMKYFTITALAYGLLLATEALPQAKGSHPVTLQEDTTAYVLNNGVVSARIDKRSGDLLSMRFKDMEMLATIMGPDGLPDTTVDKPGANLRGGGKRYTDHQYGFWSH